MKKLLIIVIALLFASTTFAQKHMTFKGHSMGCTVDEMKDNLKKDGYKVIGSEEDDTILEGIFSGSQAKIYLYPNPKGYLDKAVVSYDMSTLQWRQIKTHMETLETGLTRKYGEPSSTTKEYDNLYDEGSGREIAGFIRGTNIYSIIWELETGNILLMFTATSQTPPIVLLAYQDKINSEEASQQAYNDL